jgi:uncharacterized protein
MTFQVYRDAKKEYRWRLYAVNDKIIADSGEGYHNKADCLGMIEYIQKCGAAAKVQDLTGAA